MSRRSSWNFWGGVAIIAVFGAYALWNARDLLSGASLAIEAPVTVEGDYPAVELRGSVSRAATHLAVNGFAIRTDESGTWRSEQLLLAGQNIFTVESRDRFGKRESLTRVVWYLPKQP